MKLTDCMRSRYLFGIAATVLGTIIIRAATNSHSAGWHDGSQPGGSEIGPGPRRSVVGIYLARFELRPPPRARQLHTLWVFSEDSSAAPVGCAVVSVDDGMPQHGHALLTRLRVAESPGSGGNVIEGARFNMRGWWGLKLAIGSPAGEDAVTLDFDP